MKVIGMAQLRRLKNRARLRLKRSKQVMRIPKRKSRRW